MKPEENHNNFGAIRWLAATLVVFSHSYLLTNRSEFFSSFLGIDLGASAVIIFFTLSGYLITGSAQARSLFIFWLSRAFRIFPGLISCTVITAICLSLLSTLPWQQYFSDRKTLEYAFGTGTLLYMQLYLPGVFDGKQANGSLWTLKFEVACYVYIFLIVFLLKFRPRLVLILTIISAGVAPIVNLLVQLHFFHLPSQISYFLELLLPFLIGSLFRQLKLSAPKTWVLIFVLVAAFWFSTSVAYKPLCSILISLATMAMGLRAISILKHMNTLPDYSYGIYIYAYPIQQVMVSLKPEINPLVLFASSLCMVMIPAASSWYMVEAPALRFARAFSNRADPRSLSMGTRV